MIKDNNVNVSFFSFLASEARDYRYNDDVYNFLLDNFVNEEDFKTKDSLYIISVFEQTEFEKRLEKFPPKINSRKRFRAKADTRRNDNVSKFSSSLEK